MTDQPKSFNRIISVHDLDVILNALRNAGNEIHNPGFASANNFDVLDLIDQAKLIIFKTDGSVSS